MFTNKFGKPHCLRVQEFIYYLLRSFKGTLAEVLLHYPPSVKVVATGYTNPIAVALVRGTVIVADRMGNVYCLDLHSKS